MSDSEKQEENAVMDEPPVLPHDAKFMTPEKTLLSGSPIDSDPHLYMITLKNWADFLRFLEPVSRKIFGQDSPTPTLPVFFKIYESITHSDKAIITFMGLSGFRKKCLLSYSFNYTLKSGEYTSYRKVDIEKIDELQQKIKALEKKGYIVVPGEIDPYF